MKKSEMIAIIDIELIQRTVFESHQDGNGAWDSYKVAELILAKIEESGMLPPKTITSGDPDWEPNVYAPAPTSSNEWEPE
jgi:hypothetical protein